MSAYGYARSFDPVPDAPMTLPMAPQAAPINYRPLSLPDLPTQSWENSNLGYNSAFGNDPVYNKDKKASLTYMTTDKNPLYFMGGGKDGYWANPLEAIFGIADERVNKYLKKTAYTNDQKAGFRELAAPRYDLGAGSELRPRTLADLTNYINNLGPENLSSLDQNSLQMREAFGALGQSYQNAFSNEKYAGGKGKVAELRGTGIDRKDWSLGKAKNYLQDSYNQVLNKLNDNYLL